MIAWPGDFDLQPAPGSPDELRTVLLRRIDSNAHRLPNTRGRLGFYAALRDDLSARVDLEQVRLQQEFPVRD